MIRIQRHLLWIIFTLVGLGAAVFMTTQAADQPGFTPTFRRWVRTTTGYISDNTPFTKEKYNPENLDLTGIHTIYANDKALSVFLSGKKQPFPDGSVIVAEFYRALAYIPGKVYLDDGRNPKFTLWMIKDSANNPTTGGWRWEAWAVDKTGKDVPMGGKALESATQKTNCVSCHVMLANDTDLVIDSFSDVAHINAYQQQLKDLLAGSSSASTPAATIQEMPRTPGPF